VAEGKSYRDISVLERVSDDEVALHVSNAVAKLGASTPAEAIQNAKVRGVI
jgi:DNA-binding NarL/FixJ family response regulator